MCAVRMQLTFVHVGWRAECSSVGWGLGRMVQNASAGVGDGCAVLRRIPERDCSRRQPTMRAAAVVFAACSRC